LPYCAASPVGRGGHFVQLRDFTGCF
jgi:hypothetical protein